MKRSQSHLRIRDDILSPKNLEQVRSISNFKVNPLRRSASKDHHVDVVDPFYKRMGPLE